MVASQDNGGPASAVTVAIGAGSRNETSATSGLTHYIRNLAFQVRMLYRVMCFFLSVFDVTDLFPVLHQATQTMTGVKITRETERRGARLSSTSGRDHIAYNAQFLRDDVNFIGSLLAENVACKRC